MEQQYIYQKTSSGVISPLYTLGTSLICANTVAGLEDCNIVTPVANQTIVYDTASSKWINKTFLFGSDLSDVIVTAPTGGQKLIYDSTLSKWINTTPYYYTINIYGKLNDAVVNTRVAFNLLDSANYDVYNETITNNGFVKTANQISGIRNASYPIMTTLDLTLSISAITNNGTFTLALAGDSSNTISAFNGLNNPSKTLSTSRIGVLSTTGNYYPTLLLGSNATITYVGNPAGDIAFSLVMVEV